MPKSNLPAYQIILLALYRLVSRTGILQTRLGTVCFQACYNFYKELWEARSIRQLENFARPGTTIIDVGANTGFFTRKFSEWVGRDGQIIAIEPEQNNFDTLKAALTRKNELSNVDFIRAAVSDVEESVNLVINPDHPGDHRLGEKGQPVDAITLDGLMENQITKEVSLIKVDVQGAEYLVINGALNLIQSFNPVLFLEVDEQALKEMNASSKALFNLLRELGYTIHYFTGNRIIGPITLAQALERTQALPYSDFLFLH